MKRTLNHQNPIKRHIRYVLLLLTPLLFSLTTSAHTESIYYSYDASSKTLTVYAGTRLSPHSPGWDGTTAYGGIKLGTLTANFSKVLSTAPTGVDTLIECPQQPDADRWQVATFSNITSGTYAVSMILPGSTAYVPLVFAECSFPSLTVDATAPSVTCPADQNTCSSKMPDYTGDATYSDNMTSNGDLIVTQSPVAGSTLASGTVTVTITVEDLWGNASSCSFDVTSGGGADLEVGISAAKDYVLLGYAPEECTDLTASSSNGTAPFSYSWSNSSTSATNNVCPTSTTTYSVEVKDDNGCSGTASFEVEVIDVRCANNGNSEKILMCKTTKNGSKAICVGLNAVEALKETGATVGPCDLGSGGSSDFSVETEEELQLTTRIYPNPFTDELSVEFIANRTEKVTIEAYDMSGRRIETIFRGSVNEGSEYVGSVSSEGYPTGIIFIKFTSDSETKVFKVQHL